MGLKKIFITDLDGTLLKSDRTISDTDIKTFEFLGKQNIIRVIATGRSIFSAKKVLSDDFPIDYLVFSCGAGILRWSDKQILINHNLTESDVNSIYSQLIKLDVDFCIQHEIPNNHFFDYYMHNTENNDLTRRLGIYNSYYNIINPQSYKPQKASQFIIIFKNGSENDLIKFKKIFNEYSVIRATSPLDNKSLWLEIFPNEVSKSKTCKILVEELNISPDNIGALGNDYNDLDLLEWSEKSYLVENSPDEIKSNHIIVKSNNNNGFTDAVNKWLKTF